MVTIIKNEWEKINPMSLYSATFNKRERERRKKKYGIKKEEIFYVLVA